MIKTFILIITLLLLVGCASPASEPAPANTIAPTDLPTSTPTPTPEPTPTPAPLEGRLFFDMNGSGLKDEASFNYDAERLTDERQPLQADLLAAIEAYIAGHPELQDGDLITLEEPGLSGYKLCTTSDVCATTGADGIFVLPGANATSYLKITDPNADVPALAMKYINKWNGPVVIPAYEMNGGRVPEQYLNDTEVVELDNGISIKAGESNDIGLMQGPFTLPFPNGEFFIWSWYDTDPRVGYVSNWEGNAATLEKRYDNLFKIFDNHFAVDWLLPKDTFLLAPAPGTILSVDIEQVPSSEGNSFMLITLYHKDFNIYTHFGDIELDSVIVKPGDHIERGQILGKAMVANSGPGDYPLPSMIHGQIQTKANISFPLLQSEVLDYYGISDSCSWWTSHDQPSFH